MKNIVLTSAAFSPSQYYCEVAKISMHQFHIVSSSAFLFMGFGSSLMFECILRLSNNNNKQCHPLVYSSASSFHCLHITATKEIFVVE